MTEMSYDVPGISCGHCVQSISAEVGKVAGVNGVSVDVAAKTVVVTGVGLDDGAVRAAIDEAGYAVAR